MNIPPPEKRRLRISASALDPSKIEKLAALHPFTQQERKSIDMLVDVIFPTNLPLEESLTKLQTRYAKGKSKISDVVGSSGVFVNSIGKESDLLILTSNPQDRDVWCVDPRGVLTLSVCKDTYETLGLPGKKLPFKNHSDRHVISLPLYRSTESSKVQTKQKLLLEAWDARRGAENGLAAWEVVYCSTDPHKDPEIAVEGYQERRVSPEKKKVANVHIPTPSFTLRPTSTSSNDKSDFEDELEDWNSDIFELFEWVGLACLQAQRINANDRVDPFVAVYVPPEPSRIGDITHLQWRGMLSPKFVQSIIDAALNSIKFATANPTSPKEDPCRPFFAITCHGIPNSPVSYLPLVSGELKYSDSDAPLKLSRFDAEDTWSLVVGSTPEGEHRFFLMESLGQWDTRWG